jgi:hypothetical protein
MKIWNADIFRWTKADTSRLDFLTAQEKTQKTKNKEKYPRGRPRSRREQERYNTERTWEEAEVDKLLDERQMEKLGCHRTSIKVETSKGKKYYDCYITSS